MLAVGCEADPVRVTNCWGRVASLPNAKGMEPAAMDGVQEKSVFLFYVLMS